MIKRVGFCLTLLWLANAFFGAFFGLRSGFADYPITSFQTHGDIEISALGRYGIRLCEKESCSFFHKKSPSENHYSEELCGHIDDDGLPSLLYRNALLDNNQLIVVVDTFQNEKLISTTVDMVDPKTGAITYSFEWPDIRSLVIVQEGNEKFLVILSENEIEILRTDFKSDVKKVHAIPLPAGQFQECVVSHSHQLSRLTPNSPIKETEPAYFRRYVIFNSGEGELSLWKISGPLLEADQVRFVSGIAANDRTYHISLELSEEKSLVSDNDKFSSVLANNEIKTESLRELLHRVISERNDAFVAKKEDHRRKIEEYETSWRYASVKAYEAADSFLREFIPFDDDLIPTLLNCYVTETNAKKMLESDLRARGLLEGFGKEDSETLSKGLSNAHFLGDRAGLSVLLFPAAKAHSIYSAYRRADPLLAKKLELVARNRARLRQPLARVDRYEQYYKRYANQSILLRIAKDYAPFSGRRYNTNIIKMYPKIMITTNLVWGLTELYRQVKDHGWEIAEWNAGQMTYNGIFLNVLTTAVVVISGYRINQIWKTAAIVGVIDGLSPLAQAVENRVVHHDPNRRYDYAQAAFDKLFLAAFALPKSQANVYLQPRATAAIREQGYGRWAHEYAVPYGMNALNEGLGTGGYTLTVPGGNDLLNGLILPAVEFDQEDFGNFLKDKISIRAD